MESVDELLNLIHRGAATTVSMKLKVTRSPSTLHFEGGMRPTQLLKFVNPDGLTIDRSHGTLHVQQDGSDVIRGSGHTRWFFDENDAPYTVDVDHLRILGGVDTFINPLEVIQIMNLHSLDTRQITPGTIAERKTWIIPTAALLFNETAAQPQTIEIDAETGVILARENKQQRIEAQSVEYPTDLPNPVWTGSDISWPLKDPSTDFPDPLPHSISELPPQSDNPRHLRVSISLDAVEGAFPRYRIGDSIRISLVFARDTPFMSGLETTRRAWIQPATEMDIHDTWPIILTGDGWTALSHSDKPIRHEAELKGWFFHSLFGGEMPLNDLKIERLYGGLGTFDSGATRWQELTDTDDAYTENGSWLLEVIVDATLDGAVPPQLQPQQFEASITHIVDEQLWVLGQMLPVLRCWDLETGEFLGQTYVPISVSHSSRLQFSEGLIHDFESAWSLNPGVRMLAESQPWIEPVTELDVPAPWELQESFPDGLYSLTDGELSALGRSTPAGQLEICVISNDGSRILNAGRVEDMYFVQFWGMTVFLDSNFQVQSAEEHSLGAKRERWITQEGVAAKFTEEDEIIFLDQISGSEITRWKTPEGYFTEVRILSPTHFNILVTPPAGTDYLKPVPSSVSVFRDGQWSDIKFEDVSVEI